MISQELSPQCLQKSFNHFHVVMLLGDYKKGFIIASIYLRSAVSITFSVQKHEARFQRIERLNQRSYYSSSSNAHQFNSLTCLSHLRLLDGCSTFGILPCTKSVEPQSFVFFRSVTVIRSTNKTFVKIIDQNITHFVQIIFD